MEVNKYSITSTENWEAYEIEGNENYLNDVNVSNLKSGDKIVIAWEGDSNVVEIK